MSAKKVQRQDKQLVQKIARARRLEGLKLDESLAAHWSALFARTSLNAQSFLIEWLGSSVAAVNGAQGMREILSSARMLLENGSAYKVFLRKKASGGWRTITAPAEPIKTIQRALLDLVYSRSFVHYASHAGMPRRSIMTAIATHTSASRAFYMVDIKDAYPSVDGERIRRSVTQPLLAHLAEVAPHITEEERVEVAELAVEFVCYKDRLAQGSPASVAIMNLVRYPVDCAIASYLRTQGDYAYTAYVDNLDISRRDAGKIPKEVRKRILEILFEFGFTPNTNRRKRKLDYLPADAARVPVLLGLVPHPDGRTTIQPDALKRFRAIFHQVVGKTEPTDEDRSLVAGIMGYVHMVYGDNPPSTVKKLYRECRQRFGAPGRAVGSYPENLPISSKSTGDAP